MLPLKGSSFPTSSDELRDAITGGFSQLGFAPREVVATGAAFPQLEQLRVDLSGVSAGAEPPRVKPGSPLSGTVQVQALELLGKPLSIAGMPLELQLQAREAHLREYSAEGLDRALVLERGSGNVSLEIGREELRQILLRAGRQAARQRGADIQDLQLELNATGGRTLDVRAEVVAKFGFLKATLQLTGRASVDDEMQVRLSDMDVKGSGLAAGLATSFIRPQLEKLQREPIALSALPLGALKLHDVRITTGDRIRLEAEFGG